MSACLTLVGQRTAAATQDLLRIRGTYIAQVNSQVVRTSLDRITDVLDSYNLMIFLISTIINKYISFMVCLRRGSSRFNKITPLLLY
jgi:hypothetical protein